MKKLFALLLVVVMSLALFTGCSDPVYDDFANFLNVEMTEVNAEYKMITEEVGTWEEIEDDATLKVSIDDVLLPLVDSSLTKLEGINPETEEVKAIKDKYVKVMEAYKEGLGLLSEGCTTQVQETIDAGTDKLGDAIDLLDEYNAALEELAEAHGSEIEY